MKRHIALVLLILYSITVRGMDLNFPFTSLPTELQDRILIRITQDLDQPEYDLQMLTACRQVCKRWNEELSDQTFFDVLKLPEKDTNPLATMYLIRTNKIIKLLNETFTEHRYGKLFFLIKKHPRHISVIEPVHISMWWCMSIFNDGDVTDGKKLSKSIALLVKQGMDMKKVRFVGNDERPFLSPLLEMYTLESSNTKSNPRLLELIQTAARLGAPQENLSETERATLDTLLLKD